MNSEYVDETDDIGPECQQQIGHQSSALRCAADAAAALISPDDPDERTRTLLSAVELLHWCAEDTENLTKIMDEIRRHQQDGRWRPAEQHVPHLLLDLMHMGTVRAHRREIEQYKHWETRRYLNLDHTGQAWQVFVDGETGSVDTYSLDLSDALKHVKAEL